MLRLLPGLLKAHESVPLSHLETLDFSLVAVFVPEGGGGGTSYNGLYGEAPPERGTFFRLQVYKRVGISQF